MLEKALSKHEKKVEEQLSLTTIIVEVHRIWAAEHKAPLAVTWSSVCVTAYLHLDFMCPQC